MESDPRGNVNAGADRSLVEVCATVGHLRRQPNHRQHRHVLVEDDADVGGPREANALKYRVGDRALLNKGGVRLASERKQAGDNAGDMLMNISKAEALAVATHEKIAFPARDYQHAAPPRPAIRLENKIRPLVEEPGKVA